MPEKTFEPPERSEEPTQPEDVAGHEEHKEEPASDATRRAADILARALSEAESALVSAAQEHPPTRRSRRETARASERAWLEETQSLIRTLTEHFDRALDRMAEERRLLADEVQTTARAQREHFDRAVDHMDQDRRFLTDQATSLTRTLERLERRLDEVSRLATEPRVVEQAVEPAPLPAKETAAPVEETEPTFAPGDEGLTLVISSVPGFQGLMEVQRALTRMPAIEGASVERYFDGEARIVLMLREPVTTSRLAETLRQATGQELQVEESRPDALRLRVRFQGATP
jgi:hypothetical protein